jgi:hypothetical protein
MIARGAILLGLVILMGCAGVDRPTQPPSIAPSNAPSKQVASGQCNKFPPPAGAYGGQTNTGTIIVYNNGCANIQLFYKNPPHTSAGSVVGGNWSFFSGSYTDNPVCVGTPGPSGGVVTGPCFAIAPFAPGFYPLPVYTYSPPVPPAITINIRTNVDLKTPVPPKFIIRGTPTAATGVRG